MRFQTNGLIIRETNTGEQNRIVNILTDKKSIISAFVNNARNIKSQKGSATRLLCYSRLVIYQSRDKYIVDQANSIEMFIPIRNDFSKMTLSQYFCQVIGFLAPKEEPSEEYLRLILNALFLLSKNSRPSSVIKSAFELRLMTFAGYMPDLICCKNCGRYEVSSENDKMFFLPKSAVIFCSDCIKEVSEYRIPISMGVLTAMRHCIYADFNKLFSFTLGEDSLKTLEKVCEEYMHYSLEQSFSTLDFYKAVR